MIKINTEDEQIRRKSVCEACPSNLKGICRKCGCFIIFKIKIQDADCPDNKWEIDNVQIPSA